MALCVIRDLGRMEAPSPEIRSTRDLALVTFHSPQSDPPYWHSFYHVTKDDQVFFGQTLKAKCDMTLEEYRAGLKRVPDEHLFQVVPKDVSLIMATEDEDSAKLFLKRVGLYSYDSGAFKEVPPCPEMLLDEVRIMEQLAQHPHPNIVRYYGCRVRRGLVTGFLVERLYETLHVYARTPAYAQLDKEAFFQGVKSAVAHVHSLGLAHNDISSRNIMVRKEDASPVLIDFGSCAPPGQRLLTCGSPGWSDGDFVTSAMEHDEYSLGVLKKWLENPDLLAGEIGG